MTDKPQEDRDLIDQIGEVVDTATESITQLFSGISLPKPRKVTLGAAPGLDDQAMDKMAAAADEAPVTVTVYDYCADWVNRHTVDNMDDYLATHRPEGTKVRWVTVDGLSDPGTTRQQVLPASVGARGCIQRAATRQGRGLSGREGLLPRAVHRCAHDAACRRGQPSARRAGQHISRQGHGADVSRRSGRRVRSGPAARRTGRLAHPPARRKLPCLRDARRDRRQQLPHPRALQ